MSFNEQCLCGITRPSADNPLGMCSRCRAQSLRSRAQPARHRSFDWRAYVTKYLPWLLSALTLWSMVLVGQKDVAGWALGLGTQALWLLWIFVTRNWGFLPMNIAMWVVYGRNWLLWTTP